MSLTFPSGVREPWPTPAAVLGLDLRLRTLRTDDERWLRDLYASTRAEELATVPWPDALRRAFCDQQFDLQHRHFVTHYAGAEFLAIEHAAEGPAGRLYLDRSTPEHLLVDIALFPRFRGRGIGGALLTAIREDAASRARGVGLHVANHNVAARRLYERQDFVPVESTGTHLKMRWPAAVLS